MRWCSGYVTWRAASFHSVKYRVASTRPVICRRPRVASVNVPRTESGFRGRHRHVTVAYAGRRAGGGPSVYATFGRRSRARPRSNARVSEYSSPSPTAGLKSYRARPTSPPPCVVSILIRTRVSAESASTTRRPCHSQRAALWRPNVSLGRDTPSQADSKNTVKQRRRAETLRRNVPQRREKGDAFTQVLSYGSP